MIDDGLLKRFPTPDVVLGQHVMVGPTGNVAGSAGPITSAADSLQIRLIGRGAHGSMPQASIDPVVMAASVVLRLQTIVSREVAATDAAVVTVGVLQAGTRTWSAPSSLRSAARLPRSIVASTFSVSSFCLSWPGVLAGSPAVC